jgi:hypothetical protein
VEGVRDTGEREESVEDTSTPVEVRLPAGRSGSAVWRHGDRVMRKAGPWTPTVHGFLDHLASAGFVGAPRVLGTDRDGREILEYLEGEVLSAPDWQPGQLGRWPAWARSSEALTAAGALLRRLHQAAASFRPAAPIWKQYEWPVLLPGEIVCHGDVGPHNLVYRNGLPVALIDWDSIRPNHPLLEFAAAAWKLVPLADDTAFRAAGWPEAPDLGRRLADFAHAYGITDRRRVMWALQRAKQRSLEAMRYWPISPGNAANYTALVATELDWLATHTDRLGHHLD